MSLNNGWTYVWQGTNAALYPKDRPTIVGAIKATGGSNVTYVPGTALDKEIDINAAASARATLTWWSFAWAKVRTLRHRATLRI
jgi:hypothetical protein